MIASRFQIMDAQFAWYRDFCNYCRFSCKGLLQAKVGAIGINDGAAVFSYKKLLFKFAPYSYKGAFINYGLGGVGDLAAGIP